MMTLSDEEKQLLEKAITWVTFNARLTPAERAEMLHIAEGKTCRQAAELDGVAPETIRARRKRIYRKTDVDGAHALICQLLAYTLRELGKTPKTKTGT